MEEHMRFMQSVILLLLVTLAALGADPHPNESDSAREQIVPWLLKIPASDCPKAVTLIFLPQPQEIELALSAGPDFFFQAEDGIRDYKVTGVQTCALPISAAVGIRRCATSASPSSTTRRW